MSKGRGNVRVVELIDTHSQTHTMNMDIDMDNSTYMIHGWIHKYRR